MNIIMQGKETNYSTLHQAIVNGDVSEFEVAPRSNGIAVGITLYEGATDRCSHTHT